jgi:hypothetical protein
VVDYSRVIANATAPQSASFNVTGTGNVGSALSVGGNLSAVSLSTTGSVTVGGNLSANSFSGDGSGLAGVATLAAASNTFTGSASFNNLSFTGSLSGRVVANAVAQAASDTACAAANAGSIYFNTSTDALRVCTGTSFQDVAFSPSWAAWSSSASSSFGPSSWTTITSLSLTGGGLLDVLGQLTVQCTGTTGAYLRVTVDGAPVTESVVQMNGSLTTVPLIGFTQVPQGGHATVLDASLFNGSSGSCMIFGAPYSQLRVMVR